MCPFPSPGMPVTPVLRTDIVVRLLASRVYVDYRGLFLPRKLK